MSLNNISLPPQLVVDLYQNVLIEGNARSVPQKKGLSILGRNEKNILILVNHKSSPFLPDKELAFLTTVLSACQLDLSHVAIVNWEKAQAKDSGLLQQLMPKHVLFLDVPPALLGFSADSLPYTVQKEGAIQFVQAPSLTEIEKSKQAKSALWIALKQLFCL